MTTQAKKKQRRRSPGFIAGLVLLFVAIVILLTLAMFTSFDEVTNVFEAGKVDIVLTETEWKPEDGDNTVFLKVTIPYDDDENLQIEYPHQDDSTQSGMVAYTNTAKNKVPIYKFVATGKKDKYPDGQNWAGDLASWAGSYEPDVTSSNQHINPGWVLVDLNGTDNPMVDETHKTFTYIYAHVADDNDNLLAEVLPGQTVAYPLFNKVYLQNFRERDEVKDNSGHVTQTAFPDPTRDYSIHIEAYGIQANFLKQNNTTTRDPYDVWTNYINVSN